MSEAWFEVRGKKTIPCPKPALNARARARQRVQEEINRDREERARAIRREEAEKRWHREYCGRTNERRTICPCKDCEEDGWDDMLDKWHDSLQ